MTEPTKDAGVTEPDAVIKEEGTTVKVQVEGSDSGKSAEELAEERHQEILEQRSKDAQRDVEDKKAAVRDAETRLERAKAELEDAEQSADDAGAKAKGPTKASLAELHEDQIEHGKAPIAPGPEEPVSLDDAKAAKENRGRGLGG